MRVHLARPARRTVRGGAVVAVLALLATGATGACGQGAGLATLQEQPVADLRALDPALAAALTEVRRSEREGGESLGKPVLARIGVTYTVAGEPGDLLEVVARVLEEEGWSTEPVTDTLAGPILVGTRSLPQGRADVSVTATQDERVSGVDGPALVHVLRLAPGG